MCVPCRAVPVASRVPNVWCVLGELVQAGRWASGEFQKPSSAAQFTFELHVILFRSSGLRCVSDSSIVLGPP